MKLITYKMKKRYSNKVAQNIRIVNNAVKSFARTYISSDKMTSSTRNIIKLLASRYRRSNEDIIEQLHEQFQVLKQPLVKNKIEQGIADGERIRDQIVDQNITGIFETNVLFIREFFQAGERGAPHFCENGIMQHKIAKQTLNFFETTREYRLAMKTNLHKTSTSSRHEHAYAVTLQKRDQSGQHSSDSNKDSKNEMYRGRKCVCNEIHLFKECPYIITSARTSDGKEDKKLRNEIRDRIKSNLAYYKSIKEIINTIILNEITETSIRKKKNDQKDDNHHQDVAEMNTNHSPPHFRFDNTIIARSSFNSLAKSVVYDSKCNSSLTYDKSRFVDDITSIDEGMNIPNEPMQVKGYETMLIQGHIDDRNRDLFFAKTAWVLITDMTLISVNKLEKEGFIGDMYADKLIQKSTGMAICEIQEHFGLATLEYNPMNRPVEMKKDRPVERKDILPRSNLPKTPHKKMISNKTNTRFWTLGGANPPNKETSSNKNPDNDEIGPRNRHLIKNNHLIMQKTPSGQKRSKRSSFFKAEGVCQR